MKIKSPLRLICVCFVLFIYASPTSAQQTKPAGREDKYEARADLKRGTTAFQSGKYKTAFAILKPIAEDGNANAQTMLGLMYDSGEGVSLDSAEAANWFRLAAEQGHPIAQVNLGSMKFEGRGTSQSYQSAAYWFSKAAEQGNVRAQLNLGVCYANGQGVIRDYLSAARWFEAAAIQGDVTAQFNLGKMYLSGDGLIQDSAAAAEWLEKASAQGDNRAQELLRSIPPLQISKTPKRLNRIIYPDNNTQVKVSQSHQACLNFGFRPNDDGFSQCLLRLAEAKRQAEQWRMQYDLQLRQYQHQLDIYNAQQEEIRREKNRKENEALIRFGVGMMNSQSPTLAGGLVDGMNAMNGVQVVQQPVPPPQLPAIQNFTVRTPNGTQVYCSYLTATGGIDCR